MTIFSIITGTKVSQFANPDWVKESYTALSEAVADYIKLVKETESERETLEEASERENWIEGYEPEDSEKYFVELCKFESDDEDELELVDFNGSEFTTENAQLLKDNRLPISGWITTDYFYLKN